MQFTDSQINRYSRQMILSEVGGKGQKKLQDAKVLVIGAGGLGSGLTDGDVVDLSNLQRQILHTTDRIGVPKVESGGQLLSALNPEINLQLYPEHVSKENIMPLLEQYDIILDGSDNFSTRFLINDACFMRAFPVIDACIRNRRLLG
jgi:adenylyltransferase/sulfurtransferase